MLARVPRIVLAVASLVIGAGVAMVAIGARTVGVTWDEKTHVLMLDTFLRSGWNVSPDALLADGNPDPDYIWGVYVYGPVGELFAHAVSAILKQEAWWGVDLSSDAYAGRHLGVAVMALAAVVAVGLTVRIITKSRAWGLFGAALLASIPLWIGHGMFNIKDTPVATGYSLATLGIVGLLCSGPSRRWHMWRCAGAVIVGTVLAAGTRAAIGVPIFVGLAGALLVYVALAGRTSSWPSALRTGAARLAWGAGSLVVAYLLLIVIYPKAFANPVVLAWQALVVSARFPFDEAVLTAGMWMQQPPPPSYLPLWFGAQLPLLVLVGALGGVVWFVVGAVRAFLRFHGLMSPTQLAMVSAAVLQMLFLPVLAVAMQSNMYNGSRQFLFVVPAAAVLTAVFVWLLQRWIAQRWPSRKSLVVAVWSLTCLGIVAPVLTSVRLLPYNYTFYNAVAAMAPIDGNWPTDYWRASGRELLQRVPVTGAESCLYEQGDDVRLHPCLSEPMFAPYAEERGEKASSTALPLADYWGVRENQGDTSVPQGCILVDQVTRPLWWQEVVIGQVFACDR